MATYVYRYAFPNGKVYIGITSNLKARHRQHRTRAKGGSALPLYNAVRKYGLPKQEVISEHELREDALKEEARLIALLDSRGGKGYNTTRGGESDPSDAGRAGGLASAALGVSKVSAFLASMAAVASGANLKASAAAVAAGAPSKGGKANAEKSSKPVVNLETGEEFRSISYAAEREGVGNSAIRGRIRRGKWAFKRG